MLSHVQLCNPMDYLVHGILQARILEWVAFPFPRGSSQPRDRILVSHIAGGSLPTESQGKTKILEWVAYPFSSRSFWPRNWTRVSCIAGRFFTNWATRKAHSKPIENHKISSVSMCGEVKVKATQLCPTLCEPMGYTVHGILQGRILEWVVFPSSGESSPPRDGIQVSCIAGRFFTSWATREVPMSGEIEPNFCWEELQIILQGELEHWSLFLKPIYHQHWHVYGESIYLKNDSMRLVWPQWAKFFYNHCLQSSDCWYILYNIIGQKTKKQVIYFMWK